MRIMIVDDSGTMRTIQRRCLEKLGVTSIVEAPNGQVALDLFDQTTIDLVLTDWNMPIMDGLTLLKEIRSRNKEVPIIMLTTLACKTNVVSALAAGVSDYLIKPFTPELLQEKLDKWISTRV
ncbi:MAG: response regulator [Planctomycetes bacterium]|nr:response regulator [Planctomycetota bacterium]